MSPVLYEISQSSVDQLSRTMEANGALVVRRSELKRTAEAEEQYWSVRVDEYEIFSFSVALEPSGRLLLVVGPKRKSPHDHLYDLFVTLLEASDARKLDKL